MMVASNNGAGMAMGFPDPKMTPPLGAPIPYPNMGMNCMSAVFSPNLPIDSMSGGRASRRRWATTRPSSPSSSLSSHSFWATWTSRPPYLPVRPRPASAAAVKRSRSSEIILKRRGVTPRDRLPRPVNLPGKAGICSVGELMSTRQQRKAGY